MQTAIPGTALGSSGVGRVFRLLPWLLALMVLGSCGRQDTVEEHRKLSLRLEHRPPVSVPANEPVDLRATVQSSLEGPKIEVWVRILGADGADGADEILPFTLSGTEARCVLPARPKGGEVRYVIEARDAAGLIVTLPRGADEGRFYQLRFEGRNSRVLGFLAFLSAAIGTLLYLGAGLAGFQCVRARMSAGPAGLLGGLGVAVTIAGVFLIGGIHAFQVTGHLWPSAPVFFAITRSELGIVTLLWIANLVAGRRVLLDEDLGDTARSERPFALVAVVAAVVTLVLLVT
jgi:hypothetical protein